MQILVKTFEQRRQGRGHLQPHRRRRAWSYKRAPQTARADADIGAAGLVEGQQRRLRGQMKLKLAAHETLVFKARGTVACWPTGSTSSSSQRSVNPAVDGVVQPC